MVEMMIAAGVLGIGVLAAVQLFMSSARGSAWSRSRAIALELANQRGEFLAGMPAGALPNCAQDPPRCRATRTTVVDPIMPDGAFQCSQWVDEMGLVDPADVAAQGRYRLDTALAPHPDTSQPAAQVLTVSVCWLDERGDVQQAQARRLLGQW